MTINEILRNPDLYYRVSPYEREILLSLATNMPKEYVLAHSEKKLNKNEIKKFDKLCKRRAHGEPIAYLLGKKEFFGLDFSVNKHVLIPRPETELLVEKTMEKIDSLFCHPRARLPARQKSGEDKLTIIDIGTGSGNIIISIAKNIPAEIRKKINFFAFDNSSDTLKVARANARKHKLGKKINFINSDLLDYFLKKKKLNSKNILIIANLPYVSLDIYKKNKDLLKFEPKSALLSSKRGINHHIRLINEIKLIIKTCYMLRITCFMEFSPKQKPMLSALIKKHLPAVKVQFFKDLAGKWRAVEVKVTSQ